MCTKFILYFNILQFNCKTHAPAVILLIFIDLNSKQREMQLTVYSRYSPSFMRVFYKHATSLWSQSMHYI
jgi:hypothetical protein